jgi:hypothetical protein
MVFYVIFPIPNNGQKLLKMLQNFLKSNVWTFLKISIKRLDKRLFTKNIRALLKIFFRANKNEITE